MNVFIFNPQSRRAGLKKKIENYLIHLGVQGELIEIKKENLVGKGVEEAIDKGADTIIAIGGDGLVNRAIQSIAKTDVSMGVIPIGETNLFANMLGITNWKKGCESLVNKKTIDINLGIISKEKYFTSSIEVEGKAQEKLSLIKRVIGKNNKKYHPITVHIEDDGSKFKVQTNISSVLITTMSLSPQKGIDIEKEIEDQKLNIIIKSKPSQEGRGKHDIVSAFSGQKVEIESKSGVYIKADGEHSGKAGVLIEICQRCLKAIVAEK